MPRPSKKYHYIYRITNLIKNYYYVGMHSTDDLNDKYFGSGKRLRYSITKYGKENHTMEILEFIHDRKTLADRECEIVNETMLKDPLCINLKIGGGIGSLGHSFEHTEETKRKISEAKIGKPMKSYNLSDENRLKRNLNFKSKTNETRQKLRELRLGKPAYNRRSIVVDGVEYSDLLTASLETGIKITTIGCRIKSNNIKFKNTHYVDSPK
jgi:hypothetical protein